MLTKNHAFAADEQAEKPYEPFKSITLTAPHLFSITSHLAEHNRLLAQLIDHFQSLTHSNQLVAETIDHLRGSIVVAIEDLQVRRE